MTIIKTLKRLILLLITWSALVSPLTAQRRQPPTPKPKTAQPAPQEVQPTFDTLLAADSYKVYGEVSAVGQLIRSSGVNDLLDPIMKLAGPPKEFKTIVKWLNAHADALVTSRMMVAAWPVRANLPRFLCVIEFSSVEEAQKFEPQLLDFLPKLFPTPTPTPSPTAGSSAPTARTENPSRPAQPKPADSAALPYLVKRSGSLLLITDTPFTFRNLRPSGSKLLVEDQNFRAAHDRFSSESIFLFLNVALDDKSAPKPEALPEGPVRSARNEAEKKDEPGVVTANQAQPRGAGGGTREEQAANVEAQPSPAPSYSPPTAGEQPTTVVTAEPPAPENVAQQQEAQAFQMAISNSFFGVSPRWPEAVGAAITLDADSYVIRTLLLSGTDHKPSAVPFIPQLISGPALVPASPSILPGDSELFVTASLDYQQMYDGMMRAFVSQNEKMRRAARQTTRDNEPESPFAYYEKKIGIKVKDDLLPLLGNEIALTVPIRSLDAGPPGASASPSPDESKAEDGSEKSKQPVGPHAVVAIGIKDREAVKKLIPKIFDSLGVKGASLFAQTEKREDTELVSYAGAFAYAFIGDFLVIGTDVPTTRHVIDSYLNHQTLASDSHFRNFTRWQPRQVLAQLYISPALMESLNRWWLTGSPTGTVNDKMTDFLTRISPVAEPVTYALSNEGFGPFHELHVPKNLVMLTVAGISSEVSKTPIETNEAIAKSVLRVVASAESSYQSTTGNGNYGSLDQLIEHELVQKELLQNYGYKIEVNAAGKSFSVTAVPLEYGKTGNISFFIDESAVLKGADHGGGPATADDQPIR